MMQYKKTIAVALIAAVTGIGAAHAQSLRNDGTPAEFPPASYKGKQYVDSRGCIFIRAGIDGATSWVPRVARDRKMICGQTPTFSKNSQVATAPTPVKTVPLIKPPAPVVKTKPAPVKPVAPKVVYRQPTTNKPVRTVTVTKPKKVTPAPVAVATTTTNCPGVSAHSQKYLNHPTANVRCGPQTMLPHYAGATTSSHRKAPTLHQPQVVQHHSGVQTAYASTSPNTRVVPRHVYEQRGNAITVTKPPKGYKNAWDDDRLNPRRAEQTWAGIAQTNSIWWKTTPRTLKSTPAPVVVTNPYGSHGVTTSISSKGSMPAATSYTHNAVYVHVANYRTSAEAQTVAQRVKRMGMPVRIGRVERGYDSYRMVIAGPFASPSAAQSALAKAHKAGYRNAKLR